MANKNPFEIRFDILALAKEMLDKQYDMAQENYQTMMKQTKDSAKTMEDMNKYGLPWVAIDDPEFELA